MGGKIVLNTTVSGINLNNGTVEGVSYIQQGIKKKQLTAMRLFSTIHCRNIKAFPGYLTKDIMRNASTP